MNPEERFQRWIAIGMPLLVSGGIACIVAIHLGYQIPWQHLFVPAGLYVGLQIGFFMSAFWARKLARLQGRFGPMVLLCGFYLWGTGVILIHYGAKWGILPSNNDCFSFSVLMAAITVILWILAVKFGKKVVGAISQ